MKHLLLALSIALLWSCSNTPPALPLGVGDSTDTDSDSVKHYDY